MSGLSVLVDDLFERPESEGRSLALVVKRGGDVIIERYGSRPADALRPPLDITDQTPLISWSMAKSITHAAVGILVADGLVDVDAPAPVPAWAGTPKAAITTLDLLEMRSGLHFNEDYVGDGDDVSNCIEMLFGESGPSHAAYAANQPLVHEPGTVWNYSSGTTNIICGIVGDIVNGAPGGDPAAREAGVRSWLKRRLFGPTGMHSAEPRFDAAGDFVGSSYVDATARDFARFGELYLHDGVTECGRGERLLPLGWSDHAKHRIAVDPETGLGYGRHWWSWPTIPGSLSCHGYEGQYTIVVPTADAVVVHLGKTDISMAPSLRLRLGAIVAELA